MSSLWQRPNGPQSIAASSSSQSGLNTQQSLAALSPATLTLTSTTETVVPHPQNTSIAFVCPLSPNQGLEQVPFDLVASGYIKTTNTTNITAKLYSGTSLTVGSDTLLNSSGTVAQNSATAPWRCKAELLYDSVSGKLTGTVEWLINNNLVAKAAVSNVVTGISDANNPVASFVLSFTSSAASGGNPTTVNVKQLTVG